jgi:hypothetical protein
MTDVIVEQTEGTVTLTDEHAVEIGRMGVSQLMHETTSLGGAAIPIYESDVAVAVIGLAGPEYTGNSEETAVIGITAVCPGEAEYEELLQYPSEGFGPTRPESVPAPATTTTLGELLVA